MPIPVGTSTLGDMMRAVLAKGTEAAKAAADVRVRSAAGPVDAVSLIRMCRLLFECRAAFAKAAASAGLVQFARDQFGDQALNITTELNASITAIDSVLSWVTAAIPTGTGSYLLLYTLSNWQLQPRTVSTAAAAELRTRLAAFEATITL